MSQLNDCTAMSRNDCFAPQSLAFVSLHLVVATCIWIGDVTLGPMNPNDSIKWNVGLAPDYQSIGAGLRETPHHLAGQHVAIALSSGRPGLNSNNGVLKVEPEGSRTTVCNTPSTNMVSGCATSRTDASLFHETC